MADLKFQKNDIHDLFLNCKKAFSTDNMEIIANEVVNMYIERFDAQAWFDNITWQKGKKKSGATLIKSGQMRNSIRMFSVTKDSFVIISDTDYSEVHNEGGIVTSKKGSFTMPKRQFMGEDDMINEMIENELIRILEEG